MTFMKRTLVFSCLFTIAFQAFCQINSGVFYFKIIDENTNRGLPLVELKTRSSVAFYSDNNGVISITDPTYLNREVYFTISSPGYSFPLDFFGNPGQTFHLTPGQNITLKMSRQNIAERMYRMTGEGLYHQSVVAGLPVPKDLPFIDADLTGIDATMARVYKDKIYWFWGDSQHLSGFLGHFSMTGATTPKDIDPNSVIPFNYFKSEDGSNKKMTPIQGPGMIWHHWMEVGR